MKVSLPVRTPILRFALLASLTLSIVCSTLNYASLIETMAGICDSALIVPFG